MNASDTLPAVRAVDCHAHVMCLGAPLSAERHSVPARDVPADEIVAVLDRHGVSHGVLTGPSFYGVDNSILLDALSRYPDRLRGTVIVDPETEPALETLAGRGVVGVRLNWVQRQRRPDPASRGYRRLFDAVRECAWHVELFLEGEHLPDVLPILRQAGVALVLDHFGCPEPKTGVASVGFRAVLDAVREGMAWVKLSAPYRLRGADPRPYVDALLQAGGPERLLWGSDFPWVGHEGGCTYQECLDALRTWVPDESARRVVLAEAPRRVFHF